ncbi:MAG: hypothetical protein KJS73_11560, partial [Gammaproteobacteria bacterium]|nr:hypothetical protein [Gammaproteobacteria bacterium]
MKSDAVCPHPLSSPLRPSSIASGADSIITLNTRDFPLDYCSSLGVSVLSPDAALSEMLIEDPLG